MGCPILATAPHTALRDTKGDQKKKKENERSEPVLRDVGKREHWSVGSHGNGVTGKGLWAELEFMEEAECKKMLKGEQIPIFVSLLSVYASHRECLKMDVNCESGKEYSGAAGEWTEHRQFLPSIEFCAAKVSSFGSNLNHTIFGSFFTWYFDLLS